jgi:NAD(P)-dependent dehydrogenase (short-subunit alcohol dehydrogenase family)
MADRGGDTNARVAVVTGASSGIGKAAAAALARMNWRVIAMGRDPGRSAEAVAEIRNQAPGARVDMIVADLALMTEAERAAREVAALTDRVDVLLNNAGGIGKERVVTAEGNEALFAGNHLGAFLLTQRLLPLLRKASQLSGPGETRIVNVSSSASDFSQGMDWNDLQSLDNYKPSAAYCNVKLANLLFTRALAARLRSDNIVVNAMHPGVVATRFGEYGNDETKQTLEALKDVTVTPEEGADTLVWLAVDKDAGATTGGYFYQRQPARINPLAEDEEAAERLWRESEALVARSGG